MKSSVASRKESVPIEIFLRVKHPTMDPAEITEALGIEPEHSVHAGPAASRSGVQRLHSESYWLARLPMRSFHEMVLGVRTFSAPNALPTFSKEKHIKMRDATQYDVYILDALQQLTVKKAFLQQLNRQGSIALLIQRPDHVTPLSLCASLTRLAELGITLEID